MNVLRCLSAVKSLMNGTLQLSAIDVHLGRRTFAICSNGMTHFYRQHDMSLTTPGCLSVQPVRFAWFTKSKYGPRTPPTKPLNFNHSGDGIQELPPIDPSLPKPGYQQSEELKTADELVQRIFSLGFATRRDRKEHQKLKLLSLVNDHPNDYISHATKIARLTLYIRQQIPYCLKFRKDIAAKMHLNNNIQTRNRFLKELLMTDRAKFDQVCDALQVKYIPVVRKEDYVPKFVRPQALHKARLESEAIRNEKLKALEEKLALEKEKFYAEKEIMMAQIEADLDAMGIDGQAMLNEILEKERKQERWLNSKWYKFLQRFPTAKKKYVTMKVQQ